MNATPRWKVCGVVECFRDHVCHNDRDCLAKAPTIVETPPGVLSWGTLAKIKAGAWLVLDRDHYYSIGAHSRTIPAGTQCVVMENGLREIWQGLVVSVEDEAIAKWLIHAQEDHNGCMLVHPDGHLLSPFRLQEADIADWT